MLTPRRKVRYEPRGLRALSRDSLATETNDEVECNAMTIAVLRTGVRTWARCGIRLFFLLIFAVINWPRILGSFAM